MTQKLSDKNIKFNALTKAEKRVAIAEDVIKWINEGKFIPKNGTYVTLPDYTDGKFTGEEPADKIFNQEKCEACALGACFIGMVDLGNNIKLGEVFMMSSYEKSIIDDTIIYLEMICKLSNIFTKNQLDLIETSFELGQIDTSYEEWQKEYDLVKKAVLFGKEYDYPNERLIAIMKNIVKNNGTFKP